MAHQVAVTVHAPLKAGQFSALDLLLRRATPGHPIVAFDRMPSVHFARIVALEAETDLSGEKIESSVIYMADVDGGARRHLGVLVRQARGQVDLVFGHCVGYPTTPTDQQRISWLYSHRARPAAYYVHRVGRTVGQIQAEKELRLRTERIADVRVEAATQAGSTPAPDAEVLAEQLRAEVLSSPTYQWAHKSAPGPGLLFRLRETVHLVLVPLILLLFLPLVVPILLVGIVLIRIRESRDVPESGQVDMAHLENVRQFEDIATQNPLTAIGFRKPGLVRKIAMWAGLEGLSYANRHIYNRDNLAGVRSIHFARWVPLDQGRRLIFASSYDGSAESYMDDFINELHWGINLIFSNGVGFPATRWLIKGGAQDEIAYKNFLARHQVPTPVFFTAYPDLTAVNVDSASQLRSGLADDRAAASNWLGQL